MKSIAILLIFIWLGGCGSKQAPLKVYTLQAPFNRSMPSGKYIQKTIKVTYTRSLREKIDYKMHYSYSSSEHGVYQNSQWSNSIGRLMQGILVQTLEQSRLFKAVLPYTSTVREDYRLESNIFDFSHSVRGSSSYAVVSINFNLIDIGTGKLLKSRRFSYREQTATIDAKGYVEATNKIMVRLSYDLLGWL